ncbi:MAG: OmpA family protein [Labilithrix sp.]|nr:OmpA family protein [Labilithrix sp.]
MKLRCAIFPALLTTFASTEHALADEARFHAAAGAAHAVGGPQQREFGPGGGGSATIELPMTPVFGVQASAGGLVLSQGSAPTDPTIAQQGAGTAFLGTAGVRVHPLGATRAAGPWFDANGGLAQTGANGRFAIDAHVGWDFRVAEKSRLDVGPFVGFTQIVQSDSSLRPDDARIVWAGLAVSLGAREPSKPVVAPARGRVEPPPIADRDGVAEAFDICPAPEQIEAAIPPGCPVPEVALVGDRIVLDDVIHFEYDSPVIRPQSASLVRHVARFISANPAILEVSIEGHADARGTEEHNQRLSEARAASTRAMLIRFGVDEKQLKVVGHGKSRLKVPTQLAEPRNRRVEFIVSRDARDAGPPPPPPASSSGKRGRP